MIRLDKYLSDNAYLTRKTAKRALHRGDVTVDGDVVKKGDIKISTQEVCINGEVISVLGAIYVALHKPADYVCSTVDDDGTSVLQLIDEPWAEKLHIAGRLDKDTTGLVLLTDDGQWSHKITAPNSHCEKEYIVTVMEPLTSELVDVFAAGIELNYETKLTKPAKLTIIDEFTASLIISEGKYHQVKRMFAAVNNHVTSLHRQKIGTLSLDSTINEGQWRRLTEQEVLSLT